MIQNQEDPRVAAALARCRETIPAAVPLLDLAGSHPDGYEFRPDRSDFEFAALREVDGRPNRAMLKIFTIADGPLRGQAAVFFYKRSQVPFSRDRFSYGVVTLPPGAGPGEVAGWLDFASGGFDPEARPSRLRLAFTFTVPD